ncbi:MAG: branched-chain amino acid ABC transporter permease [Egibacteraceae bacterium]
MATISRLRDRLDITNPVTKAWTALPTWPRRLLALAGVLFLYILPSLRIPLLDTPGSDFASVLFYPVGMYVLLGIGLNIVIGQAGLLDLGYVAFFAIGAYTMAVLGTTVGLSFWVILPIAVALSMAAGVILGSPTLRLRGDYLAIVTLGFGEIIRLTARNTPSLGGPRGIAGIPHPPDIGPLEFGVLDSRPYYWLLLSFIILVIFFVRRLERSRVGRAWTAIREDEDAAELMGVPTFRFKLWAFAMGAGIGGMGGTIFASKVIAITPDNFTLILSILLASAVVLGGSGNMVGVIVGAIVIGYLPERFREFQELRVLIFGAALVAMMVFRPQGLIPSRRRSAELSHAPPGAMGALGAETEADLATSEVGGRHD